MLADRDPFHLGEVSTLRVGSVKVECVRPQASVAPTVQAAPSAARTWSSIRCSPALTR